MSIKCKKCGNEVPEGSEFCNKCGTKILLNNINSDTEIKTTDVANSNKKHVIKKIYFIFPIFGIILAILYYIVLRYMKNNGYNFVGNYGYLVPFIIVILFITPAIIMVIKSMIKGNKKTIIITIAILLLVGVGYKIIEPPSTEMVFQKIKNYDADKTTSYLDKVYPQNGKIFGLFKQKDRDNKVKVLGLMVKYYGDKFKMETGRSVEDYKAVKIAKVNIEQPTYSSDYANINVTVDNGGKTPVYYIKVNLYYKDKSGKIIRSDWTNDDAIIQPGASQVITKMTKDDGWDSVHAEIAEIK